MISTYKRLLFVIWVLCVSVDSRALGVSIVTYEIPEVLESKRSGSYDHILQTVEQALGQPINYHVLPPGRARALFDNKKRDCILPFDKDFIEPNDSLIQSEYLNLAKAYIYTAPTTAPVTSVDQLKGLLVAVRHGMSFGKALDNVDLTLLEVVALKQSIRMLHSGRVDAFIAYDPDIRFVFKELNMDPLSHDPGSPLVIHEDAILCHDLPRTRLFLTSFDRALRLLKKQGVVRELLGESYVAP